MFWSRLGRKETDPHRKVARNRNAFQKWYPRVEVLEDRTAPAASPTASLSALPAAPLIGEAFSFTVTFDNTSPTDTGSGPFVNLYLPATGIDGAGGAVDDGVTFVGATYLGTAVNATVITLTATGVPHPFAKDASGQPVIVTPARGVPRGRSTRRVAGALRQFYPRISPGDTFEYTINFQVSDYFAFQNLVLTDLRSDGQEYVPGSATLAVTDGHAGGTTGAFANATLTRNVTGGSDRLLLGVSAELAARGFLPNGRLVGEASPAGGTGAGPLPSAPPLPFGPTTGAVTFRTVIRDRYEIDFPSGDPALNQGDPIGNTVTISGDLLNVTDLTP